MGRGSLSGFTSRAPQERRVRRFRAARARAVSSAAPAGGTSPRFDGTLEALSDTEQWNAPPSTFSPGASTTLAMHLPVEEQIRPAPHSALETHAPHCPFVQTRS